jgi:hypothetical protein
MIRASRLRIVLALTALALGVQAREARATTYDITPAIDWHTTLQNLQPGDVVVAHAGTYAELTAGLHVTWNGTSAAPIIVRAAAGENRPVLQGVSTQNVMDVQGTYFTFQGFELTGGGSRGVYVVAAANATFQDLYTHDVPDDGFTSNVSGATYDHVNIQHCEIARTGTNSAIGNGIYVGCPSAACVFQNSTIALNYVHDLAGTTSAVGIWVREGSFANDIRDNVVLRPGTDGIDTYWFSGSGARNIVERNYVQANSSGVGIYAAGQGVVRNNVVLGGLPGIWSGVDHGNIPSNVSITNNTVDIPGGTCLQSNWANTSGNVLANNALYCEGGTAINFGNGAGSAMVTGNVVVGTSNATGGTSSGRSVALDFPNAASGNLYPSGGSPLIGAANSSSSATDDFNASARTDGSPDVGAYERSTPQNPGWIPTAGFKTLLVGGTAAPGLPRVGLMALAAALLFAGARVLRRPADRRV